MARGIDHGLDSDIPVTAENVFHLVLHLKLAFLQRHLLHLFRSRKVRLATKLIKGVSSS